MTNIPQISILSTNISFDIQQIDINIFMFYHIFGKYLIFLTLPYYRQKTYKKLLNLAHILNPFSIYFNNLYMIQGTIIVNLLDKTSHFTKKKMKMIYK